MMVEANVRAASFEVSKRSHQEPGLTNEPFGASINRRARLEHAEREPLKCADVLLIESQRVEETKTLGNEPCAKTEGRLCAGFSSSPARKAKEHLALGFGQDVALRLEPLGQSRHEV
jgi:hypothetical protein